MSLWSRIGNVFQADKVNREIEEEFEAHIAEAIAQGRDPEEARRAFGSALRQREMSHAIRVLGWLENFLQDSAYGVRSMLRSPALTMVALLSLALGIGANTAIFSLLDAVMLRSLPVKDPAQLVLLGTGTASGKTDDFARTELYSYPFYRQLREKNQVFSDTAAMCSMTNAVHGFVEGRTDSEPMNVKLVSGTYFTTLGVRAWKGRTLNDADDNSEGDHPVAVISYAWWKRSLARDPNVLNRELKLGNMIYNIVGVAPPEFFGTKVGEAPDMWIPLSMIKEVPPNFGGYRDNFSESLFILARLKPGVSSTQATSNVNLLFRQILLGFPDAELSQENRRELDKAQVPLTPMATGLSSLRRQFSEPLQILMAVVALVLLIACANIANLLLARSTARARELAVRQALGARRTRLIRQLLTESLILALFGGALGVAFASAGNRLLLRMISGGPETIPLNVSIDLRLLAFALAVTVATAILFGTIPAFRSTRLELTNTLKAGRGPQDTLRKNRLARVLIVSQVSLSLVLMVGAGLFLRSLVNLDKIDTGFNRENVLRLEIDSSSAGYKPGEPRAIALDQEIEERVSALPSVRAASFSAFTFHEGSWGSNVVVPGTNIGQSVDVKHNVVGDGYFATMQIPLLRGRSFSPSDTSTSQRVAIISEHLAKVLFPLGNPLGRHYGLGDDKPENDVIVVGIAKNVKFGELAEDPVNLDYFPYTQRPWDFGDFEVRYTGAYAPIAAAVQQTIHSIDRNLPISKVTTLDEQVARTLTNQRLVAQLCTFFGVLSGFLSCIGIYGLMSYVVSRRTNEIGIRMALGAARFTVGWLVIRETLWLAVVGIAIGIPIALGGSRLVSDMLYGFRGADPASLAAVVMLLLLVALFAGYFPARRASKVDPMVALRYE